MQKQSPRPPRSRGAIIVVLLVFALVLGSIYFAWNITTDILSPVSPSGQGHPVTIIVQEGETVQQLADELQQKKLIRSALAFRIWAKIRGLDGAHLQAGTYSNLNTSMNISDIIDELLTAQPNQILVRVPEGWRLEQIAAKIDQVGLPNFKKADFLKYTQNPETFPDKNKFPILKDIPKGGSMEGLLFPDSYFFSLNASTTEVIDRLLTAFTDKVQQNHLDTLAKANHMSVYQMIILASIVERESANPADSPGIASVYLNRVTHPDYETVGLLQADPTVQYARDSQSQPAKYWEPLQSAPAQTAPDSPWNTYTHKGWPPTPICSPALESLKAAASPAHTDYYYFLTNPKTGRAVFAKTKAEFDQDVQKYLQ